MLRTLFLQAPSFDGFDGGAGSRYPAKRENRSFWLSTLLGPPTGPGPGSPPIRRPRAQAGRRPGERLRPGGGALLGALVPERREVRRGDEGGHSEAQGGRVR